MANGRIRGPVMLTLGGVPTVIGAVLFVSGLTNVPFRFTSMDGIMWGMLGFFMAFLGVPMVIIGLVWTVRDRRA